MAFQAKERAKRKIELLEKAFEIEKLHLWNEEIEHKTVPNMWN